MPINPLQIPGYAQPQAINFSALGNLPQVYQKAQQEQARKQTLAELGQGAGPLDYDMASRKLLAVGDREGALSLAQLGNNNRDFQFRQQEANRAQGNVDRSFSLQERTANEAARGFDYREVDDGSGGKMLVRINKATSEVSKPPIAGQQEQPSNPYAYGKQNENQSKDSGYASRMFQSEPILRDPKLAAASQSMFDRAADRLLPGDVSNKIVSEGYQKYDQAARDFINATLRRESGAAISQSEFDNAYKQYLPRPGDTPEVLKQKQNNRQETIKAIAGGGGQTYKPPFLFGPNGEMTPNAKAQAAPPAKSPGAVPQTNSGAKPVASKAEFDALPSGTTFIAPDGTTRIKP